MVLSNDQLVDAFYDLIRAFESTLALLTPNGRSTAEFGVPAKAY